MEEQLRKLVEHAEPKPKSFIFVSGNSSNLKTSFIPPLDFPPSYRYEMALTSLETILFQTSTPQTITSKHSSFDEAKTWQDVGGYEIKVINTELQRFITQKTVDKKAEKRIVLSPNPNTSRCMLEVLDVKSQVNFNEDDSLCTVLGFDKKVYTMGRHESEHIVNILSVNSILVHCDVIESSRLDGIEAPVIYTFFPDAAPGDKIISIQKYLIYIPLTPNVISRMTC